MVFGGNKMVKYLQSSQSWLADGTFKLSPKIFYQLYTVHIHGPVKANPELSLALKVIPTLAFEKLENVKSSFRLIVQYIQEVCQQLSLDSSKVEKIDELWPSFQNTYIEKNWESLYSPRRYGTKEKLHRKALLELQTWLQVGILAFKFSFWARIQVCGDHWKIWRKMLQPKSVSICSQLQVWSFRGERSTENWKRRWKTQLNVIRMKIQLPSSERWLPCQCKNELCKTFFINFACIVPEFPKISIFSKTTRLFSAKI